MSYSIKSELRVAIIVLAAGSGSRFGHSTNKVWLPLSGKRIISHSLINAVSSFDHCRTILVINSNEEELAREVLLNEVPNIGIELVEGGETRHESEYNALMYLESEIKDGRINVVLIHDGARPLASKALFREIADTALRFGGALPAINVEPLELELVTERKVVRVQTPQAFRAKELLVAYQKAKMEDFTGTDTAACMERYFPEVESIAVEGEVNNIKVTYPQDLTIAEHLIQVAPMQIGLE
jgi:2-C-methyl-D-erythritol 4-phosphate cytidylyltransferase